MTKVAYEIMDIVDELPLQYQQQVKDYAEDLYTDFGTSLEEEIEDFEVS